MKKFQKFGAVLAALCLGLFCFAACNTDDNGSTVLRVNLTGSTNGYKMYDYSGSYYTKGYITYNGYITQNSESVAGEFNIIGSTLRIELYEGQTLSTGAYFYIADGNNYRIGRVYFTKTNDKLEANYEEYWYY